MNSSLPISGYQINKDKLPVHKVDYLSDQIYFHFLKDYSYENSYNEVSFSYNELISSNKSVVITRKGVSGHNYDKGMIDIFNPQFSIPKINLDYLELTDLNNKLNFKKYFLKNFNIYVTKGIVSTRGTHYDGEKQYKIFIYLTDVTLNSDGPYSYVPYSPCFLPIMRIFAFIKRVALRDYYSKDFSFLDVFLKKIYGKAGTIILSNQEGLHRGTSQDKDGRRVMLVANYLYES